METMKFLAKNSQLTRQDILTFPFPYKLWVVVNLDLCDFLCWNRDGTIIILNLSSLQDYLHSMWSIFKIRNSSCFLTHLEEYKFVRLPVNTLDMKDTSVVLEFKHIHFQRHRLDLLRNLCSQRYRVPYRCQEVLGCSQNRKAHKLEDLCFKSFGVLSNIQKSRLRLNMLLQFQHAKCVLKAKHRATDADFEAFNNDLSQGDQHLKKSRKIGTDDGSEGGAHLSSVSIEKDLGYYSPGLRTQSATTSILEPVLYTDFYKETSISDKHLDIEAQSQYKVDFSSFFRQFRSALNVLDE